MKPNQGCQLSTFEKGDTFSRDPTEFFKFVEPSQMPQLSFLKKVKPSHGPQQSFSDESETFSGAATVFFLSK